MLPNDRKYTKSHEWLKVEDDGTATIGITDFAQKELGDITFVEMPELDEKKDAGEECVEIESVKAASDVYAPVAGLVKAVNEELEDSPQLVNQSPFEKGWLFKLGEISQSDVEALLDAEGYEKILKEQG